MDFLYYGEANVYQENLDSFFSMAEDFKLKGLTGNNKAAATSNSSSNIKKSLSINDQRNFEETDLSKSKETKEGLAMEGTVPVTDHIVAADLHNLDGQSKMEKDKKYDGIRIMMENGETISDGGQRGILAVCKICGKQGTDSDIRRHIKTNHHACNICGKTSKSRDGLRRHMSIYHK